MQITTKVLDDVRAFALAAHEGQTDKLGHPYGAHVAHVAARCARYGAEYEAVGWLHDTVEDCDVNLDEIERRFGAIVRLGVDAKTKRSGERYFQDYLPRVMEHPIGIVVKYQDADHNRAKVHLIEDAETRSRLDQKYGSVLRILGQAQSQLKRHSLEGPLTWNGSAWIETRTSRD